MESFFSSLVAFVTAVITVISGSPAQTTNPVVMPIVEQIAPRNDVTSIENRVPVTASKREPETKIKKIAPPPVSISEPEPKIEYLPIVPVVSAQTQSTEPPRTYTNERGQITTEDGTVLWSPSPPPIAIPTTTPVVDEIACGYEVEAGLPLGSKCPKSSDPFPCYPNQPWTCRPSPFQQTINGVPTSPVYQGGSIVNPRNGDGSLKKPCSADVAGLGQKWCI